MMRRWSAFAMRLRLDASTKSQPFKSCWRRSACCQCNNELSQPSLRCEVAGEVEEQLGQPVAGIGIDGAVVGGHNRHVVGDGSIDSVQRRYYGLHLAVRPQGQIAEWARR